MTNKIWTISLFGVVFSVFLILAYLLYQDIDTTSNTRLWEESTTKVKMITAEAMQQNSEQDVLLRSYIFSSKTEFKSLFIATSVKTRKTLTNLKSLVLDNTTQLNRAIELERLHQQKDKISEYLVNELSYRTIDQDTLNQELMDCDSLILEMRSVANKLKTEQDYLLKGRRLDFEQQIRESKRSALYLTIALFIILILALLFILWSYTKMTKSTKIVDQQNKKLTSIQVDLESRNEDLKFISEKFNNSLFHSKVAAFYWNNTAEDEFWMSNSFYTMLGLEKNEFITSVTEFFSVHMHPEDSPRVYERLMSNLEHGTPYNLEYRLRKKDGTYSHFRAIGDTSTEDNIQRMTGVVINIDKEIELRSIREKMTSSLEEYSLRFDLLLKCSEYGVWDWYDISQPTQWWSESFYKLIGYTEEELVSNETNFRSIIHPEDALITHNAVENCIKNGVKVNIEYRLKTKNDGYIWFRAVADRTIDESDSSKIRMIGVVSDITSEKLSSEELKRSNVDLLDFASIASHDLQEPLRKIQAFGSRLKSLCENEGVDFKGLPLVDKLNESATRMRTLIDDLLNYSRVSNESNFTDEVELPELISEVEGFLSDIIETSNTEIIVQENLPTLYQVNRGNIFQLFQNLISNAIKFQEAGTKPIIEISSRIMELNEVREVAPHLSGYNQYHRIEVKDNGIGFDEQYLEKIFTAFQRLHGRSEYKGTGIGLGVCQKLCANHGGIISANSELGKGATFYVILPVKEQISQE